MSKVGVITRGEVEAGRRKEPFGDIPAVTVPWSPGMLVIVPAVLTALGLLLYLQNRTVTGTSQFFDPVAPALALTAPAVGSVIVSRRPSNVVGWLLCATGLVGLAFFAEQYAVYALVTDAGSLPAATWIAWLGSWIWVPGLLPLTTLVVLLFPDGRLGSSRWTSLAWAAGALVLVASVSAALAADGTGSPAPVNPAAVTGLPQLSNLAEAATGACTLVLAPLCLVGLLVRHRRSSAERRQQLRWFVAGAVVAVAAPFAGIFLPLRLHQALALVGVAGLIGGIVVGAARYRLYEIDGREIDLLLGRAAVYGALALAAGVVYWVMHVLAVRLGVRAGLGPSAVALVAVVVAWRPLRAQATDAVERLRSPRRAYQALRSLGHCLESSMVPDHVLPALAGTIAAALELPYVAVEVGSDEEVTAAAVYGEPQEEVIVVPLVHHHEVVGRLTVAARPGEGLQPTDLRLLRDLASQAGAAAYGVRLTADLRRSRERLVTAREENWRDVRRQLHDRLGPLDGILLAIGAATNTLGRGDAAGTNAVLARLKGELRSEIADIRALIDELRPRSLDEFGLVGALERQAALLALPPRPLTVTVEAADLAGLPSAVEVAAYQIVGEAVTNVRRHAHARHCQVRLAVSAGWLELEVSDDGTGIPCEFVEGVGLSCMRERASELGGSFSVATSAAGGTSVCVEIPLWNH